MISSPLILNTTGDVHTPPLKCLHQGRREHVSPNFSCIRETCLRLPQLFAGRVHLQGYLTDNETHPPRTLP